MLKTIGNKVANFAYKKPKAAGAVALFIVGVLFLGAIAHL